MRPFSLFNVNEVEKTALVIKEILILGRTHMKPEYLKNLLLSEI